MVAPVATLQGTLKPYMISMKTILNLLVAASLAAFAGTAFAQSPATATGTANATIIKPITLTGENAGLNFGDVVRPSTAGYVILVPSLAEDGSYTLTYAPGTQPGASMAAQNPPELAEFLVTGAPNYDIDIMVPYQNTTLDNLYDYYLLLPSQPQQNPDWQEHLYAQLNSEGHFTVYVGGKLHVTSTAALGAHSGTFPITVQYN